MRQLMLGVMLIFLVASARSQSTWNNLRFGSSFKEVQQSLSKQGLDLRQGRGGRWVAEPGWDLNVNNVFVYHFSPELTFDEKDTLQKLSLEFNSTWVAGQRFDPYQATSSILEQLTSKYGAPASETGACKADIVDYLHGRFMSCDTIWKGDGQSVSLSWVYESHKLGTGDLSLSIVYQALQSSGL